MQALIDLEKEQAEKSILEYFDYDLNDVSKKELQVFSSEAIVEISHNRNSAEASHFKIFSIYEVAVVFIHQELTNSTSHGFFDACINTKKHKENSASLVHVACEFGNAYKSYAKKEEIVQLNKHLIDEVKKAKVDKLDDESVAYAYKTLFDENGSFLAKNHLAKMLEIQQKFSNESMEARKVLSKDDIFSLMVLFQTYHDEKLLDVYTNIKNLCNIPTIKNLTIKDEIKYIANDYIDTKDKKYLEIFNAFFIRLSSYIMHRYFLKIDDAHIDHLFCQISGEVRTQKWYDRVIMKKDKYLLAVNTMKIQYELYKAEQGYADVALDTKVFSQDFKIFYSVSVLVHEYDRYFNTVERLSKLLNEDFSGCFEANGMNIKIFYEKTNKSIEIEAVNRFLIFWMRFNEKSLQKKKATFTKKS